MQIQLVELQKIGKLESSHLNCLRSTIGTIPCIGKMESSQLEPYPLPPSTIHAGLPIHAPKSGTEWGVGAGLRLRAVADVSIRTRLPATPACPSTRACGHRLTRHQMGTSCQRCQWARKLSAPRASSLPLLQRYGGGK